MCTTCGCGSGAQDHEHGHAHEHEHEHEHEHGHEHEHPHGESPVRTHAPGLTQARMVEIEQDILAKNNRFARANRAFFAERGVLALNLLSSPGSGKTTLLVKTIAAMKGATKVYVIEGDQQTDHDAERIRAAGSPAVQINTGKGCHLDGHMVGHAVESLDRSEGGIGAGGVVFIENVGNLVCPAAFDLGEAYKVVILSVTEGEDKPLKYPDMFAAASLMIINKIDLLPHVDFDRDCAVAFARRVNPGLRVLSLSARTGEGFDAWLQWIGAARGLAMAGCAELAKAV